MMVGMTRSTPSFALARYIAAESFRFNSEGKAPALDPTIARMASGHTTAVTPGMVRYLVSRGWLANPAAGQYVVTESGRKLVSKAVKLQRGGK